MHVAMSQSKSKFITRINESVKMNFDGSMDVSGSLCCWSPNGRFLAVVASKARLVIRDAKNLEVLFSEVCSSVPVSSSSSSSTTSSRSASILNPDDTKLDKVGFSPDSTLVFVSSFKAGITHVFQSFGNIDYLKKELCNSDHRPLTGSIVLLGLIAIPFKDKMVQKSEPRWKAKITEGVAGLSDIIFTPDSRHLLAFSELNVKLTLWSFVQKKVRYIKYPKARSCVQFSPDGRYLSVVERRDGHDCVSLFDCTDWTIVKHFETESSDCAEISWSPKSESICIWSTILEFSFLVYALNGDLIFKFVPETIGLGIASVSWSPCGNLLAVAGCNGVIRFFNTLNWSLITELFGVSDCIHQTQVAVYEEIEVPVKDIDIKLAKELFSHKPETEFRAVTKRPVIISTDRDRKGVTKSLRCSDFKFRADGKFLAVRCDALPSTVFIFGVSGLRLDSVIAHRFPVTSLTWGPVPPYSDCLTILTSDGGLHAWSPLGVASLNIPLTDAEELRIDYFHWNPRGKAMALQTREKIMCCRVGINA